MEHRAGLAEIASFFGSELVWAPVLPKRTVLQDAVRRGQPLRGICSRSAQELCADFSALADRIGAVRVVS